MRLKNVRGANDIVINSPYYIDSKTVPKGNYKQIFNNNNPIQIEIGTGKGNFIIQKAIKNPDINYIGIEKYASVLMRAIQKLDNDEIPNLKIMMFDANDINEVFASEIDTIYLNFSDPWPKKRHAHRRLTNYLFLDKYKQIFIKENHIVMKTDNRHLFEYSLKSFVDNDFKIVDISLDLYNDDIKDNIPTEYETKFHNKGNPIYMVEVKK
ncbi:MAG: tRNA (guanosine(46)-N7)-methyltransferase TrmB [Bacilli bacterium]|nr:tRNA (guanosine(46)-N7)-methyltransferase TrmB [Bacilli bacterium]